MTEGPISVAEFNQSTVTVATDLLRACCASRSWISIMLANRPYGSRDSVIAVSDEILNDLNSQDLDEALAAHPRIGERAAGPGRESAWSREEQSATADSTESIRAQLREANIAYEAAFDQVFLICATGLSTAQMLRSLQGRLSNSPAAEREIVRAELTKIVRLRLTKALR
ncbi:2-oxo-4-hydroxy-4-carboxy-5-ureidoimidazoline decarboxylase [Jatrophihabitans sp. DSM 45814]